MEESTFLRPQNRLAAALAKLSDVCQRNSKLTESVVARVRNNETEGNVANFTSAIITQHTQQTRRKETPPTPPTRSVSLIRKKSRLFAYSAQNTFLFLDLVIVKFLDMKINPVLPTTIFMIVEMVKVCFSKVHRPQFSLQLTNTITMRVH